MADKKQETIADIIAEKRRRADVIERVVAEKMKRGGMISDQYARELIADIRKEADRLEAAHRREKAAIEADALAVGGVVEAERKRELSKNTSKNGADFGQLGDAAKLREAVGYILKYADCAACRDHDEHTRHYIDQIRKWAQAALAAPPRNCDIGTAEEQYRRHGKFCNAIRNGMSGYHCEDAPRCVFCFAKWLQMPYEEGVADGTAT